jgi:hypothetical protein
MQHNQSTAAEGANNQQLPTQAAAHQALRQSHIIVSGVNRGQQ